MNDKNERLDNLIDHALASYTPQEARPGLEQRVVASIASAAEVNRLRPWRWRPVWVLVAAAALVAVVAIPVAIKFARPGIAVVHPPAVAEHSPQIAAAPTSPARHTLAARVRPAATEPEVLDIVTQSSTDLIAPVTIAPIRNQPLTSELIDVKPITIAPIQISALN